ncbi:hypothetical protein WS86_07780 [Burkholderia savannae]|nr:hypothetical protein WS86_07780 [Burkholderia savannae]
MQARDGGDASAARAPRRLRPPIRRCIRHARRRASPAASLIGIAMPAADIASIAFQAVRRASALTAPSAPIA